MTTIETVTAQVTNGCGEFASCEVELVFELDPRVPGSGTVTPHCEGGMRRDMTEVAQERGWPFIEIESVDTSALPEPFRSVKRWDMSDLYPLSFTAEKYVVEAYASYRDEGWKTLFREMFDTEEAAEARASEIRTFLDPLGDACDPAEWQFYVDVDVEDAVVYPD